MINFPNCTRDLIELFPETIGLELEDFDLAREVSDRAGGEARQWQIYLTVLAVLAFERWMSVRVQDKPITWNNCSLFQPKFANFINVASPVQVGDFRLCLVATESFVDEVVTIPRATIELPELVAHFYVVVEVREEEEEAIVRGILRYDELMNYQQSFKLQTDDRDGYEIPLDWFDVESNHLLSDIRFLDPSTIPLPAQSLLVQAKDMADGAVTQAVADLSQWLQGIFETGWETVEALLDPPQAQPAFRFRKAPKAKNSSLERSTTRVERVKQLDFVVGATNSSVALVVGLTPITSTKIAISVEIYPIRGLNKLPEALKLVLLDEAGEAIMQAQARSSESVQLEFRGDLEDRFSVEVFLGNVRLSEAFRV